MTELGTFLRAARKANHMTIRECASRVGCAESYLSLLERGGRGTRGPAPALLKRIAAELGIPFEVLLSKQAGHGYDAFLIKAESKSVIQILRESLGDTRQRFAERIGLAPEQVAVMEDQKVSSETVQLVCSRLFARYRLLPPTQKALFDRVLEVFCTEPKETSVLLERFLWVLLDPELPMGAPMANTSYRE